MTASPPAVSPADVRRRRAEHERQGNLALGLLVLAGLASGAALFAVGTPTARWVLAVHAVVGLALLVLAPIKTRVVERGLRRARPTRAVSVALAVFAVATVLSGLAHTAGMRGLGPLSVMQVHVPAAIVTGLLTLWHAFARPAKPRRTDLSRRTALRAATVLAAGTATWGAVELALRLTDAPGARRRFTGSHRLERPRPTIWFADDVPEIDTAAWRLRLVEPTSTRELALSDLPPRSWHEATIDCTNGWYAAVLWDVLPLSELVADGANARSFVVTSITGYQRRFPIRDLDRVLLATGLDGELLPRVHGGPARVIAPGRRGFWWVKWVEEVRLDDAPWWWQPPFPLT